VIGLSAGQTAALHPRRPQRDPRRYGVVMTLGTADIATRAPAGAWRFSSRGGR
jgi:hypothetical protein